MFIPFASRPPKHRSSDRQAPRDLIKEKAEQAFNAKLTEIDRQIKVKCGEVEDLEARIAAQEVDLAAAANEEDPETREFFIGEANGHIVRLQAERTVVAVEIDRLTSELARINVPGGWKAFRPAAAASRQPEPKSKKDKGAGKKKGKVKAA